MLDLDKALDVATKASQLSADFLTRSFKEFHEHPAAHRISTKSGPRDFVTDVDKAAQEIIVRSVRESFPDHRFLAEEEGADSIGKPGCPYRWIIDPLDGTTNFIHHKTSFATMIALEDHGKIMLGIIALPLQNLLYSAVRGRGALINGKAARLRKTKNLSDAIVSTNFMGRAKNINGNVCTVTSVLCGSLHNYGVAAKEMGDILRGENDGVVYDGVGLWDVAAAAVMIEEAGGRVRIEPKDPADIRKGVVCVASTSEIFDELWNFIQNDSRLRV